MKPSELLEKYDWCQRDYARDINHCVTTIHSPNAVKFCLLGAIKKVDKEGYANLLSDYCLLVFGSIHIPYVNDNILKTKQDAINLLKQVEEIYEKEQRKVHT